MDSIKKFISLGLTAVLIFFSITACNSKANNGQNNISNAASGTINGSSGEIVNIKNMNGSVDEKVEYLLSKMTLDEKAGQMVQGSLAGIKPDGVKRYCIGSVLSGGGEAPLRNTKEGWMEACKAYQEAAMSTRLGIPIIYGIDALHGHNTAAGAVVFPHNIGLGAADDPELMAEIGNVTASEMIATGINWAFAPCIAVARDIRWGRTYESYSENPDLVRKLSVPYIKALQENYQITACAKHYLADGGTIWNPGKDKHDIDQGDAPISEKELRDIHLPAYKEAVDAGVKTIMVSFSSWNGVKNHENGYLIKDILKGELGFKGFVISDYEAVHQLSGGDFYGQIVNCINAGVDMLMEPRHVLESLNAIKKGVNSGDIPEKRVDDAVSRILRVKLEMGLFENPLGNQDLAAAELGLVENRQIARKAVRESLVLLKNKNNILPLKKGSKIFITGPAANNVGKQCGGWTKTWQGGVDRDGKKWMEGSTILEGFKRIAAENGGTIITDPKEAKSADVAVVVIGEKPYVEYEGDDGNLDLYSGTALSENREALKQAKETGLPIVTILVSGRPRIVTDEINDWDAFVAAWLPGTEGDAVADVLYGLYGFKGKLPFSWPKSAVQLPINYGNYHEEPLFEYGYSLD